MSKNDDEGTRIAPRYTEKHWRDKDWIKISQKIDEGIATEKDWKRGIRIFEDRIRGRYLDVIDTIQSQRYSGFAVMALDCLLIETLQQFYEGKRETPRSKNQEYFVKFLTNQDSPFAPLFDEESANCFYEDIRCGILHQAETKGHSKIRRRTGEKAVNKEKEAVIIHRRKFHELLVEEFERYICQLRDEKDQTLRKNFKFKMDRICNLPYSIGILAYGSLLKKPGKELSDVIIDRITTTTPFEVEFARTSCSRDGAPTLVPVSSGCGCKVRAKILVLRAGIDQATAYNMLYRREINCIDKLDKVYNDREQRQKEDAVIIDHMQEFENVSLILYASLKSNLEYILQPDTPPKTKAEKLAELAIDSVTRKTYDEKRDGIQYLADAIKSGIKTPLRDLYRQTILEKTNTRDLISARAIVAKEKGLI